MDPVLRGYLGDLRDHVAWEEHEEMGVNARSQFGDTPLHFAVCDARLDVVRLLLQVGAEVNVRDGDEYTPLDQAVEFKLWDIVRLLREHGAVLHMYDEEDLRDASGA